MAQAGTPPSGTEPQNGGTSTQTPEAGKRKIAGKYDSIEEAVEKGYVGLEQGFHNLSETVGKLTKIMEAAMAGSDESDYRAPSGMPVGRGGPAADPYGRQPAHPDDIDPKEFILNPGEFLRKRDEQILIRVGNVVSAAMANAQVVNEFKAQNPKLAKHEKLVQLMLRDENPRDPLPTRLANAGKRAEAYLAQMKAELTGQPAALPNGSEYVERPAGEPFQPGFQPPAGNNQTTAEEQELIEYINERQAGYSSHFGGPPQNVK